MNCRVRDITHEVYRFLDMLDIGFVTNEDYFPLPQCIKAVSRLLNFVNIRNDLVFEFEDGTEVPACLFV